MLNGEQNITWNSDVKWFAKSSGTTNDKSKFIPVTNESLEGCHFKAGKDMLSLYCNKYPNSKIFSGKGLTIGGSHQINQLNHNSFYGDLSAVLMQNLPMWVHMIRTPDLSIALMGDWEEKIVKLGNSTVPENVTSLSGVPTWTLILLKWIQDNYHQKYIKDVWPGLEAYFHGGVNFAPYKEQFELLVGPGRLNYMEIYNASEGFIGMQDLKEGGEMLLMLDYGIFFEFMPMSELESDYPKTLSLCEVALNTNYALIITTNAGLWRYKIGDTIQFTNLNPYRFKITGRTKHHINTFGEELMVENAEVALAKTCQENNCLVSEFTVAPIFMTLDKKGGHEWLIEFEKEPINLMDFTEQLDRNLKSVNSDYQAKRSANLAMDLPTVRSVKQGTFYQWMKTKGKLGGQNKVPRLSSNREILESILEISF
jgi:hypothetical protein